MVAALNIGDSVERGFTVFFAWLPALIGALVVLVIGYFVAKFVMKLVSNGLKRAGLDRALHNGQGGQMIQKVTSSPASVIGRLAFWGIMLGAISLAVSVLGINALTNFVAAVYAYLPNVIAAVLIFLVAGAIAAAISGIAMRVMGDTGLGKIVATAAPILVMTIATFMILDQLQIAETIVTITYAALLGAIALGSAIAFGLGGQQVAAQMLQTTYDKGQQNKEQWKQELDQGVTRAKEEARRQKEQMQQSRDGSETGAATPSR
jgi:hypothetical protein